MPVVFFPHGGGPWPFVQLGFPQAELDAMAAYLRGVPALAPTPPRAVLVISAHWEEAKPTLMTAARPPMLYDYYGFPPEAYQITWPAPGDPGLADRVRQLLHGARIESGSDGTRGFDHGTFVPLKVMYPAADIPTVQLSLKAGLDPREHLALGRALAPLRDEGVFIMGSGMTFHNLRVFGDPRAQEPARRFDDWLRATMAASPSEREGRLAEWTRAPAARQAHPREEHLMPLLVAAGAAGISPASLAFTGTISGLAISGYQFA